MVKLLSLAALVLTITSAQDPLYDGLWIDSQANRIELHSAKTEVTVDCPNCRFETTDRVYEVPLKFKAAINDGTLSGTQIGGGGNLLWSASPGPLGMMRLKIEIPGVEPMQLVMARDPFTRPASGAVRLIGKPDTKGRRLVFELLQASSAIGQWAPAYVYIVGPDGREMAPEKETIIDLKAEGGAPLPAIARLTSQVVRVPGGIAPDSKSATLTASSEKMPPVTAVAIGCVSGSAAKLDLTARVPRATAGESIPVTVTLVDANGAPSNDGQAKQVALNVDGAATTVDIPAAECAASHAVTSTGQAKVTATYSARPETLRLSFAPTLKTGILLALIGGLIGGFASAARAFSLLSQWTASRWMWWLLVVIAGAAAVYFAWFYGLPQKLPALPANAFVAVLAGAVGGFLGAFALGNKPPAPAPSPSGRMLG